MLGKSLIVRHQPTLVSSKKNQLKLHRILNVCSINKKLIKYGVIRIVFVFSLGVIRAAVHSLEHLLCVCLLTHIPLLI